MMKKIFYSKFMVWLLLSLVVTFNTIAQTSAPCTNSPNGLFPSSIFTHPNIGPLCTGAAPPFYSIATNAWAGEYSIVSLQAQTYRFTSSVTTDYITITDTISSSLTVIAHGPQPLDVAIPATGGYRFYRHTNSSCGTQNTSRTVSIGCLTCPGGTFGTTQPSTTAINAGTNDNQVLRIDIGAANCGTVTQINFTNASTNPADIANAKVYYTTSSTFSTANLFGSVANPGASFSVVGSQALSSTTINIFWLVYDVSCTAPSAPANIADASVVSVIAGSNTFTPTTANPAGTRTINAFTSPTASTAQPSTAPVSPGTTDAQVLRVDIAGSTCLGNITQLNFTQPASSVGNASAAKVYYTTTTTFSNAVQFGSTVANPGATFSVTGNQPSATSGVNYFWLVYDVSCGAPTVPANDNIDAGCSGLVATLGTFVPATQNPTGNRLISVQPGDDILNAPTAVLGVPAAGVQQNVFSIAGKSFQPNEPSPILNAQPVSTNGSGASNYSWGLAAGNTQWFKLDVPTSGYGSSGNLLIRANTSSAAPYSSSSTDAQIALWKFPNIVSGAPCGTVPNFSGGVMLAANDDAIVTGTGYTTFPGSTTSNTLNSVMRVKLNPGSTYYIQVDGYGSATPSGELIIEDLADPAGKNVPNNGLGPIHNPTGVSMRFAAYEVVGDDGWTYYYANNGTTDNIADDPLLLSINWSNSSSYLWKGTNITNSDLSSHVRRDAKSLTAPSATTLGSPTGTDAFIVWDGRNSTNAASPNLKATAPYVGSDVNTWHMMNKYWNVLPNVQPSTPVQVRFYYSDNDYSALQTAVTGSGGILTNHQDMKFMKFTKSATTHYTNSELDPALGHNAITAGTASNLTWTYSALSGGMHQAEFQVSSFSGGGGGSTGIPTSTPLSVSLQSFKAAKTNTGVLISWVMSNDHTAAEFTVEESANGLDFTSLSTQKASRAVRYEVVDANLQNGANYYRLKVKDVNGRITYSQVAIVYNETKGFSVTVAPTLVQNSVRVQLNSATNGNVSIRIVNTIGQNILMQNVKTVAGSMTVNMNLSSLASGLYNMIIVSETGERNIVKFVKE